MNKLYSHAFTYTVNYKIDVKYALWPARTLEPSPPCVTSAMRVILACPAESRRSPPPLLYNEQARGMSTLTTSQTLPPSPVYFSTCLQEVEKSFMLQKLYFLSKKCAKSIEINPPVFM
jgi:hypothetical protein